MQTCESAWQLRFDTASGRNSVTLSVVIYQIINSPELGRTPRDARPHTIEELEKKVSRTPRKAMTVERGARSRNVDIREVRDGRGAKHEDGLSLVAADQNIVAVSNSTDSTTITL